MEDNEQVNTAVNLVSAMLLVSSWAFVCARLFVRLRDRTRGADDLLMAISLAGFTACCIFTLLTNAIGVIVLDHDHVAPENYWSVARDWYRGQLYFICAQISYAITSVFIRSSLCASLLRIAQKRRHKAILGAVIATSILSATAVVTGTLTQAYPIQGLWDMDISLNTKVQLRGQKYFQKFLFVFSAISVAQDIVIAAMPALILWDLQKSRAERIRLMLLLGLGASAAIAILIRILFLTDQQYEKYGKSPIFICTIIELGIAIIAGSLAPLRMSVAEWWIDVRGRKWQKLRAQAQSQPLYGIELSARHVKTPSSANGDHGPRRGWI